MASEFAKIVVVGVGLIGGSFALALKAAGMAGRIVGVGRRPETLERARSLGIVDALGGMDAAPVAWQGRSPSLTLTLPPLGVLFLRSSQ